MSKQDFIALAETIREENRFAVDNHQPAPFNEQAILCLARFCKNQNYNFMRERWVGYIAGENGPSGGAVRKGGK
jgi:hypothetical protein